MNESLLNSEEHTSWQVRNGQCRKQGDHLPLKYLKTTDNEEWKEEKISLATGLNILYWSVFSISTASSNPLRRLDKFIAIQSVKITGVW